MAASLRLETIRRAKWIVGLLVLVVAAGGLGYLLRSGPSPDDRPAPSESASQSGASSREAGAPPPADFERPTSRKPTEPLLVRVFGATGPEAGVFVRVVEDDRKGDSHRGCSTAARTDSNGLATVAVEKPAPEPAWLELARGDATGLRHGFVSLAAVRTAIAGREPASVLLPEGGSLELRFEGLPPAARPKNVTFWLFPPFGEWRSLFADLPVLPAGDGGLVECRAVPESYRVPVGVDGVVRLAHVPSDHAVAVREMDLPPAAEAWIASDSSSDGPMTAAPEGDVLRVPEGRRIAYVQHWRARPSARVRVVSDAGQPVAGARVGYGFRHAGKPPRFFDLPASTGADGVATIVLWTGAALPAWTPEGVVFAASAKGHRTTVIEAPGSWYGLDVEVRLGAAVEGSFVVEGTLAFPNQRPAAGVPVRLASAEPFNAHGAVEPLRGTADADGRFEIAVPENLRPLFEYAGGLRVIVDDESLEAMPSDARWRGVWPSLPRATVEPSSVSLPAPHGRARTTAHLSLP